MIMRKYQRVTVEMLDEIINEYQLVVAVVTYDDGLQSIDLFPNRGKRYLGSSFMSPIFVDQYDLEDILLRQHLQNQLVAIKVVSTMSDEELKELDELTNDL